MVCQHLARHVGQPDGSPAIKVGISFYKQRGVVVAPLPSASLLACGGRGVATKADQRPGRVKASSLTPEGRSLDRIATAARTWAIAHPSYLSEVSAFCLSCCSSRCR